MMKNEIKVLVANISYYDDSIYLPYLWARLKTYAINDYPKDLSEITWLDPLYYRSDELADGDFDILALSCYIWNWEINLTLAKRAKELNPNCFVIAGGPQVPTNDFNIFEDTAFDAICYTEGELTFSEFLYAFSNNLDLDIPGIVLRTNPAKIRSFVPKLAVNELTSPWIYCETDLKKYSKLIHAEDKRANVTFETNRGCPYSCSFCDWGMATNSKIKRFDNPMLLDEIDIIMNLDPNFIFIVDANYGIFKEDLSYIEKFTKLKLEKNMKNASLTFSSAKNNKLVVNKCIKLLYKANMIPTSMISIQHTDPVVLKNMDRDNIKTQESLKEMEESFKFGIPVAGILILGCPGDTIEKWENALNDAFRMGFHEELRAFDYMLLPNAPANEPEYIERFKIGFITRTFQEHISNRKPITATFICESYSFTKSDYVEMQLMTSYGLACHILALFKFIGILGYHGLNIGYIETYKLIAKTPFISKILEEVKAQIERYVFGSIDHKFIEYKDKTVTYDQFIYLSIMDNYDKVFDEITLPEYGKYEKEIIAFQKLITVTYDKNLKAEFSYDFISYIEHAYSLSSFKVYNKLPDEKKIVCNITDTRTGLHKEINTDEIINYKDSIKKLLKAPNYRYQTTYYPALLEGSCHYES